MAFSLSGKTIADVTYQEDGTVSLPYGIGFGEGMTTMLSNVIRATQTDNEIVLYEAVKFAKWNFDNDGNEYFLDSEYEKQTDGQTPTQINYKKVFKKDANSNYYLHSIEKYN